jgi:hypothetical protein
LPNDPLEGTEQEKREVVAIYARLLGHIPAAQLDAACERVSQTARFFPKPADVIAQLDHADAVGSDLEAEGEWQKLLAWIRENYFPDVGVRRGAPKLSAVVEHAAGAAGGLHFIERCSESELVWCRKTFLVACKNVRETGHVENLLTAGDAKQILAQLKAGPQENHKKLSAIEIVSEKPSREEIHEDLKRVRRALERTPEPCPEESEAELAARWQRQKQALHERARQLGIAG